MAHKRAFFLALALTASLTCPALAADAGPVITQVSSGSCHTLAVDDGGALWGWGWNLHGELGGGTVDNSGGGEEGPFQTVPVKLMEDVTSASAGLRWSAAVRTDGTLWFWGDGKAPSKWMDDVKLVSLDKYSMRGAAVTNDGALWLWGDADSLLFAGGPLGDVSQTPVKAMEDVADAAIGYGHIMALKTDGTLWSWGADGEGEAGSGGTGHMASGGPYCAQPTQIMDHVAKLVPGCTEAMAVKDDGTLWAWGMAADGLLSWTGAHNAAGMYNEPIQTVPVQVMDGVADAAFGGGTQYVLKTDGTLWSCGGGLLGQAGSGAMEAPAPGEPPVQILTGAAQVTAGEGFALARRSDGTLWAWGGNELGELGTGGMGDRAGMSGPCQSVPVRVSFAQPSPDAGQTEVFPSVAYNLQVDGRWGRAGLYGVKDERGDRSYYITPGALAYLLWDTPANVSHEGDALISGGEYRPQNGDGGQPFVGVQRAALNEAALTVDGVSVPVSSLTITDAAGVKHSYFKLRDLGKALGFNVRWDGGYENENTGARGLVLIETDRPYTGA